MASSSSARATTMRGPPGQAWSVLYLPKNRCSLLCQLRRQSQVSIQIGSLRQIVQREARAPGMPELAEEGKAFPPGGANLLCVSLIASNIGQAQQDDGAS